MLSALSIYTNTDSILSRENHKIPLYKSRDINRILYISGVALQLSKSQNRNAIEIACAIASHLSANCGDEFIIEIVPPGYIHFVLTDPILAAWLQRLVEGRWGEGERGRGGDGESSAVRGFPALRSQCVAGVPKAAFGGKLPPKTCRPVVAPGVRLANPEGERGGQGEGGMGERGGQGETLIENSSHLFAVQYAHARCCSLMRLAEQEGLIQLNEPNTSSGMFCVISPSSIAWLNCDRKLRSCHSASFRLISQLVQVVDDLECPDQAGSVNWEKAAINLSQAFEVFWCNCRIWGEVKITSPELSQARLGLVIATQSVLRFLLEEKLAIFALVEL
nr:DALR anticodon-binding domain-containing protein [Hassalia byssoidea]